MEKNRPLRSQLERSAFILTHKVNAKRSHFKGFNRRFASKLLQLKRKAL